MGLLVRYGYTFSHTSESGQILEVAVRVYQEREAWMARRGPRLSIDDYLVDHGYPELALPFLRHEFGTPEPHCRAWSLSERLPTSVDLKAPERPERCRR